MLQSEQFYCLIVFVVVLHISQSQAAFCVCSSLQGEQEKEQEKEGKKKEEEEEGRRAFAHGTIGLEEETPVTYQITEVYTGCLKKTIFRDFLANILHKTG